MATFQKGDVVQLKSGGPEMTVQCVVGESVDSILVGDRLEFAKLEGFKDGDAICQWFVRDKLQEGTFSAESLKKIS